MSGYKGLTVFNPAPMDISPTFRLVHTARLIYSISMILKLDLQQQIYEIFFSFGLGQKGLG
jgi:hypothetical protein